MNAGNRTISSTNELSRNHWDTIVIGGGIAGLVSAWESVKAGQTTLLVESRGYVGGQVASMMVGGAHVDIGAESFAPRGTAMTSMAEELGLKVTAPSGGRSHYFLPPVPHSLHTTWGLHRFPSDSMMGIPSDPASAEVRAILGDQGAMRACEDLTLPPHVGTECADVASFIEARMGRVVLDRLVRPLVAGIHSQDPEKLDVDRVLPGMRADLLHHGSLAKAVGARLEKSSGSRGDVSIEGGMQVLIDALTAEILAKGSAIATRCGAEAICCASLSASDSNTVQWQVDIRDTTPAGAPSAEPRRTSVGRLLTASRVILACSHAAALRVLTPLFPEAQECAFAPGAPIVRSFLTVRAEALDSAPVGPGLLVSPDISSVAECPVGAKALSQLDVKWAWIADELREAHGEHVHLLRLSHGRPGDEDRTPSLGELLHDASVLTGTDLGAENVINHRVIHWNGTLAQATPDLARRISALRQKAESLPGLLICGAWVSGSGIASVVADARQRVRGERRSLLFGR